MTSKKKKNLKRITHCLKKYYPKILPRIKKNNQNLSQDSQ